MSSLLLCNYLNRYLCTFIGFYIFFFLSASITERRKRWGAVLPWGTHADDEGLPQQALVLKSHSSMVAPTSISPPLVRRNSKEGSAITASPLGRRKSSTKTQNCLPSKLGKVWTTAAEKLPKTTPVPFLPQNHSNSHWLQLLSLNQGPDAFSMTANGKKIPSKNLIIKNFTLRVFFPTDPEMVILLTWASRDPSKKGRKKPGKYI